MNIKISKARIFTLRLYPGTIWRLPRIRIRDERSGLRTFIEFDTMSGLSISDQAVLYLNGKGIKIGSYFEGYYFIYLIEEYGYSEQDMDNAYDKGWHDAELGLIEE